MPDIDAIVAKLQESWPYIDIDQSMYASDEWRNLVKDVLEIAAELEKP